MAITFVSDSEQTITNASSVTVTAPASLQNGDTLVLVLHHGYAWNKALLPGWTWQGNNSNNVNIDVFTRTAAASDTSWTFNWTNIWSGCAWVGAYRGGFVQAVGHSIAASNTLTQAVGAMPTTDGLRVDVFGTRRNSSTGTIHATPGWGTSRCALSATDSSTRTVELSVADRSISGWTLPTDTWSMTNLPTYAPLMTTVWLRETAVPADVFDVTLASTDSAVKDGWVYKGRATVTQDTTGAP